MTENQKLREALQAGLHYAQEALDLHDMANQRHPSTEPERNAILDDMRLISEALALPTADHIPESGEMVADHLPNAGKMIETAAPVGEREAFEQIVVHRIGSRAIERWNDDPDAEYKNSRVEDLRGGWIMHLQWQARAALSAGDAVDALRWRYAMDWGTKDFAVCMRVGATGVCWEPIKTDGPIDAAMRKDKT